MGRSESDLRLQMLEYARQISFDISIPVENVDPTKNAPAKKTWRISLSHDDMHVRNIFRALALIEQLKAHINHMAEADWSVFGPLDITSEYIKECIENRGWHSGVDILKRTKIGKIFIEIISFIEASGRCFPHYNLHPYIEYLMRMQCNRVCYNYRCYLELSKSIIKEIPFLPQRRKAEKLSDWIAMAQEIVIQMNDLFTRFAHQFQTSEFNVSVSNFEKKASKQVVQLKDFFNSLRNDDKHISVVMKVCFEYHNATVSAREVDRQRREIDNFAQTLNDFSARLGKTTTLNGFVKMVSILKAPKLSSWHNECYIALSFPKDGYPFDYNGGSLALWDKCDESIFPVMKKLVQRERSKKHSVVARDLNELTGNGKNIDAIIAKINSSEGRKSVKRNKKESYSDTLKKFRRDQIIFDSLAFIQHVEERWRSCVKKSLQLGEKIQSGYGARLHAMVLLDDTGDIPIVSTPTVVPPKLAQGDERKSGHLLRSHDVVIYSLQMQPYLSSARGGARPKEADKIKLGLPASDDMLSEMLRTSMVTLFFMTLKLQGKTKLDEVRHIFAKDKKDKYAIPNRQKTFPSIPAISDIFSSKKE